MSTQTNELASIMADLATIRGAVGCAAMLLGLPYETTTIELCRVLARAEANNSKFGAAARLAAKQIGVKV